MGVVGQGGIVALQGLLGSLVLPGVVGLVALEGLLGFSFPFYPFYPYNTEYHDGSTCGAASAADAVGSQ